MDWVTQHFDNSRTGWNPNEPTLNVADVRQRLHLQYTVPVDGQMYAQPLYVQNLSVPGKGPHNVVFAATEGNSVYALDPDKAGALLWHRSLMVAGESPVPFQDLANCNNISPKVGITATPVIDRVAETLFVVAKSKAGSGTGATFHQRLYALDLATGVDKHGPVELSGSVTGTGDGHDANGHIAFQALWHLNRPGLLLSDGALFIAFGAHCDFNNYHGWILKYNAATLQPLGAFNVTPDHDANTTVFAGHGGGIWQGGVGLAASSHGVLYLLTGNGPFNANSGGRDYGNSAVRLTPDLAVADYFTPFDQDALNRADQDLGSGSAMILPTQTGPHPSLLVGCGKEGTIYLLDRQNLGHYHGPAGPDQVVQRLPHAIGGVWGGPAYYHGPTGQFVYYCGRDGHLRSFELANAKLTATTQSTNVYVGGFTPTVSSNGGAPGTGIVWGITRTNPLNLVAHDATNVTAQVFSAAAGPWDNPHGGAFITPTVINGKVYVGTADRLAVFGLH
jgi:hypothetical protein